MSNVRIRKLAARMAASGKKTGQPIGGLWNLKAVWTFSTIQAMWLLDATPLAASRGFPPTVTSGPGISAESNRLRGLPPIPDPRAFDRPMNVALFVDPPVLVTPSQAKF